MTGKSHKFQLQEEELGLVELESYQVDSPSLSLSVSFSLSHLEGL